MKCRTVGNNEGLMTAICGHKYIVILLVGLIVFGTYVAINLKMKLKDDRTRLKKK